MRLLVGQVSLILALTACAGPSSDPGTTLITTSTSTTAPTTTSRAPTTSAPTSPTTLAEPTTTVPQPVCRPDPFAEDLPERLATEYPGKLITAHVLDLRTGCDYSLNPDHRQRTASVLKVMVMAGTLLEAQRAGREVSEWELEQLTPMITLSANPQVRNLWRSFGGSPWFREQAATFGLSETSPVGDDGQAWGLTTTSAKDQVDLLRQVLLGEWGPIGSEYREIALDLMTSVDPSQTWGVTAGVPDDWVVAQKNGFAGITINSVGWVDEPGPSPGYVVAILSQGWPDHPSGIAAVEGISELVAAVMTAPQSG